MVNLDNLPDCSSSTEDGANRVKVDWAKLSKEDVLFYCGRSDVLLRKVQLPMDAIFCSDINCDDVTHCNDLFEMYNSIVSAISSSRFYSDMDMTMSLDEPDALFTVC